VAALKLQGGNFTTCLPGKIHMVAMELFSSVAMTKCSMLTPVLQVKYSFKHRGEPKIIIQL